MVKPSKRRSTQLRWYSSRRMLGVTALAVVAVAVASVVSWIALSGSEEAVDDGVLRAAIVDQLSLTIPNESFIDEASAKLVAADYEVDYYPGEEVTVDFMRRLPALDYDLILLRAHSDRLQGEWRGEQIDEAILFTGEPFDEGKYFDDRNEKRLTRARYFDGSEEIFGIAPEFIEERMIDDFNGATIIAMGCDSLSSSRTAQAFLDKGAGAFIGWDELVSASHTDATVDRLLEHLTSGLPAAEAVARTMAEVGPDPAYDSELVLLTDG